MGGISDQLIMNKVEKNRERGVKLGLFRPEENPDIESILDTDIIWHILEISHKVEYDDMLDKDSVHKMMLQYANLNKIRAVNRQTRNKAETTKQAESMFDRIVRAQIERDREKEGNFEKKKVDIVKKVVLGDPLTADEQMVLDAAAESEMI